jgi:hypothetical protein
MIQKTLEQTQKELPDLLDAVEKGEDVVVVHEGQRFRLSLVPRDSARKSTPAPIAVDPEVLEGNWTWATGEDGQLQFHAKRETP